MTYQIFCYRLTWAIAVLSWVLPGSPCNHSQTSKEIRNQDGPTPKQVKRTVDEITLIEGLPPKRGERIEDEHAEAIIALGEKAAPYLVEKLTDASPSKVVYGFQYKVGDVALVLLHEIYRPPNWPFPDGSFDIPRKYGDYRDYVKFVNSDGTRKRLRKSWKNYIKKNE
jgi:hypothetical protein